jgi:hypothetical protein
METGKMSDHYHSDLDLLLHCIFCGAAAELKGG